MKNLKETFRLLVKKNWGLMEGPPALSLLAGCGHLVSSTVQTLKLCETVATFSRPSYIRYLKANFYLLSISINYFTV